jgi:hypothetical protein
MAVIEFTPRGSAAVVSVATPSLRSAMPSEVEPLLKNSTLPVGVPAPGLTAATVADSDTCWPRVDGSGVTVVSVVDVLACLTVTSLGIESLGVKPLSPE